MCFLLVPWYWLHLDDPSHYYIICHAGLQLTYEETNRNKVGQLDFFVYNMEIK